MTSVGQENAGGVLGDVRACPVPLSQGPEGAWIRLLLIWCLPGGDGNPPNAVF